jgi:hypothetical protein
MYGHGVHAPSWQVPEFGQTCPHAPQLLGSVCVSTHPFPQQIRPPPHVGTRAPLLQVSQGPHAAWPPLQLPDESQYVRQSQTPLSQL